MEFDYRTFSVIVAVALAFVVRWLILRFGHQQAQLRAERTASGAKTKPIDKSARRIDESNRR